MKWFTASKHKMYYFSRTDIEFCSLNYVISYGHVLPRNLLSTGQVFLGLPHNRLTTTTHYTDFKKGLGAVTKRYFFHNILHTFPAEVQSRCPICHIYSYFFLYFYKAYTMSFLIYQWGQLNWSSIQNYIHVSTKSKLFELNTLCLITV